MPTCQVINESDDKHDGGIFGYDSLYVNTENCNDQFFGSENTSDVTADLLEVENFGMYNSEEEFKYVVPTQQKSDNQYYNFHNNQIGISNFAQINDANGFNENSNDTFNLAHKRKL